MKKPLVFINSRFFFNESLNSFRIVSFIFYMMTVDETTPKAVVVSEGEAISVDVKDANDAPISESLTTPTPSKTQFNANAVEFVPGQFRSNAAPNPAAPVFTPQFQLTANGYVPINPYAVPYYMYVPTNGATNADGTVMVSPVLTYQAATAFHPRAASGKGGLARHNSAGARSIRSEGGRTKPYRPAREETKPARETSSTEEVLEGPVIKPEDFPSMIAAPKVEVSEGTSKPSWAAIAKKTNAPVVVAEELVEPVAEPVVVAEPEAPKPVVVVARPASSIGSPRTEPREPSASAVPVSGKPKLAPWARPVVEPVPEPMEEAEAVEEQSEPEETAVEASCPSSSSSSSSEDEPVSCSGVELNLSIEMMKRLRYHESCRPNADIRGQIPIGLLRQRQVTQSGVTSSEADDWRAEAAAFAAKGRQHSRRMNHSVSKIEISPEMLIPSENSWSAAQQNGLVDEDVRVGRKIFAILNKLTIEKFAKLSDQLLNECGIAKPAHIVTLVKYLFQKATMQHHFIPMYADLCKRCLAWLSSDAAPEELVKSIGPGERLSAAADIFRRVLLERCQAAFYSYFLTPEEALKDADPERSEEDHHKHRLSMLGTVKFVAQLLDHRLMTRAVFRNCLEILLNPDGRTDDHVECACVFLSEIGKLFEEQESGADAYSRCLEDAMAELTEIAEEESTSARIRFTIMNLVDLRSNKYVVTTIAGQPAGPSKIAEVHKQAAKEEQLVRAVSRLSHSHASTTPMAVDDEWETVPRKAAIVASVAREASSAAGLTRTETVKAWKRAASNSSSE
jgi:hypothetical protein